MSEQLFRDSIYRYTDPIRYFTANDPYQYQVDNIPLKQLQENDNFLKDQLENLLEPSGGFSRSNFTELKPYVDGTNNVVKVKPGRFSARINDAFAIDPLQFITQVLGSDLGEYNTWEVKTNLNATLRTVLDKFTSTLAANSMNMNGLAERVFTFGMQTQDNPSQYLKATQGYSTSPFTPAFPNYSGRIWKSNTNVETDTVSQFRVEDSSLGFFVAGNAESEFNKRWRGITRTAIVDVPSELSISIPAFDAQDFFYTDEQGSKVLLSSNQRIDLVFIYSKPVDASSVKITTGTKITTPTLGIVKGAGLGVNLKRPGTGVPTSDGGVLLQDATGNQLMIPSVADENGDTIGFGNIKGSFPSPDDLMNISPLISENLSTDNYALVGQSILPVAYVVVRASQITNSNGVQVIPETDLIDIRPFFRTTELSYNERSGIAGATPQISLANPVASEGYVDYVARKIYNDYTSKLIGTSNPGGQPLFPRLVGCGYIKGGFNYGVEATLGHVVSKRFNIPESNAALLKQQILSRYGYPTGTVIPDNPDWDISEWCKLGNFENRGAYPNDSINFHNFGRNFNTTGGLDFGAWKDSAKQNRIIDLGTEEDGQPSTKGFSVIYFVKKTIQIDRSQILWANDYHVDAQLFNCLPLSCRSKPRGDLLDGAGGAAIWVDKRETEFTIYVSWVARDNLSLPSLGSPDTQRDNGSLFAGFSVINQDTVNYPYTQRLVDGEISAGVAVYPTVSFQVFGIPSTYNSAGNNLQGERPILTLS